MASKSLVSGHHPPLLLPNTHNSVHSKLTGLYHLQVWQDLISDGSNDALPCCLIVHNHGIPQQSIILSTLKPEQSCSCSVNLLSLHLGRERFQRCSCVSQKHPSKQSACMMSEKLEAGANVWRDWKINSLHPLLAIGHTHSDRNQLFGAHGAAGNTSMQSLHRSG